MANMALNLSWHGRIPIETSTTVSGGGLPCKTPSRRVTLQFQAGGSRLRLEFFDLKQMSNDVLHTCWLIKNDG